MLLPSYVAIGPDDDIGVGARVVGIEEELCRGGRVGGVIVGGI